ncbi:hypothetical protein SAY87_029097 [Trapa incisa]|uniref:Uncharacterized protein n=1 Tax=Trapa incisa TaxID=236973 RepID=A0AAN7QS99_9MYRT|nr:hypothetical protein SAY87_029097 [Trapa incisa]
MADSPRRSSDLFSLILDRGPEAVEVQYIKCLSYPVDSRRKRPRTPTPGHYLGLKSSRDTSYRGDRGRYRGRDDYDYRRSPRRSPYRGRDYSPRRSPYRSGRDYSPRRSPYRSGHDYSPRRSPYGGRTRRERTRSPMYSPRGYR